MSQHQPRLLWEEKWVARDEIQARGSDFNLFPRIPFCATGSTWRRLLSPAVQMYLRCPTSSVLVAPASPQEVLQQMSQHSLLSPGLPHAAGASQPPQDEGHMCHLLLGACRQLLRNSKPCPPQGAVVPGRAGRASPKASPLTFICCTWLYVAVHRHRPWCCWTSELVIHWHFGAVCTGKRTWQEISSTSGSQW